MRTESVKCPARAVIAKSKPGMCMLCRSIYLQLVKSGQPTFLTCPEWNGTRLVKSNKVFHSPEHNLAYEILTPLKSGLNERLLVSTLHPPGTLAQEVTMVVFILFSCVVTYVWRALSFLTLTLILIRSSFISKAAVTRNKIYISKLSDTFIYTPQAIFYRQSSCNGKDETFWKAYWYLLLYFLGYFFISKAAAM